MERGLEAEAQAFGELAMTDVSRRLVEIFFATTELKKDDGVPAGYGRRPSGSTGSVSSDPGSWAPASRAPRCCTRASRSG